MIKFDPETIKNLYKPDTDSQGEDNGQVTIIGGSKLFHGAPILALTAASRIVDMVFFASPEPEVGEVAQKIKSKLSSFIWVPWSDIDKYIEKSDACLLGPGFMRFKSEDASHEDRTDYCDEECQKTKEITHSLLEKHKNKKWVIDAGSLQAMDKEKLPPNSIITPNRKEFKTLFGLDPTIENAKEMAEKYDITIVLKAPVAYVVNKLEVIEINGGTAGLTKGGTGDTLAGLTVALLAKNTPQLAASAASYIIKKTAVNLHEKVGTYFNSDDLANEVPHTLNSLI